MTALDKAREAQNKITEAWIEIARLLGLIEAQRSIINIESAKVDAYLAVTHEITIADGSRGMERGR